MKTPKHLWNKARVHARTGLNVRFGCRPLERGGSSTCLLLITELGARDAWQKKRNVDGSRELVGAEALF